MTDNGIRWTKRSRGVLQFKPCPFCGGEASITASESGHGFFVGCLNDGCPINPSSGDFLLDGVYDEEMKQAAVNEWNTRARPTVGWHCSACHVVSRTIDGEPKPNYCPHCGAKVVE